DDLVVMGRVDLVGRLGLAGVLQVGPGWTLAVTGLQLLVGGFGRIVLLGLGHRAFGGFGFAVRLLRVVQRGALRRLLLALAFALVAGLGLAVLALLVLAVLVGRVGEVVAHLHVAHDGAGDAGESALVLDAVEQPVQVGAGLGLDLLAERIDQLLGGR